MTDTRPQLPNWALNIVEKHGLHQRTDEPLGGVIVLLFDAAEALKEASLIMTRDDAATPAAVEIAMSAMRMVQDALDLTAICPRDAKPGLLQEHKDGSFTRRP